MISLIGSIVLFSGVVAAYEPFALVRELTAPPSKRGSDGARERVSGHVQRNGVELRYDAQLHSSAILLDHAPALDSIECDAADGLLVRLTARSGNDLIADGALFVIIIISIETHFFA